VIRVRTLLASLVVLTALLGPVASRTQDASKETTKSSPTLDSARARWERFTPEEKERARARYERFLAMTEEEREQLVESARRLRERSDRVSSQLGAPGSKAGEKLATMDPEKRRTIVHEIVTDESRAVGARIRNQFPEDWLKRLENAKPQDRARYFRQFRIQQRNRVARYAIGELGKRLALPKAEIVRLQELPGEERCAAVLDLRKKLSTQEVGESGLPPGITREQWDTWLALPPEEFFDVFQRYRESRVFAGQKREPSPTTPPAPGNAAHREASEPLRALADALRTHPDEVLALSDLSPADRRAKINADRRQRCLRALRDGHLLPEPEIETLQGQPDAEFFASVRRVLWKPAKPSWFRRMFGALPR
jgi:hypothetical protein